MPSRSPPTYTASSVSGLGARSRPTNSLGPWPCVPQGRTGNAGAVATNRVSGPRTQPKVRPGTAAAADLSPWPRARCLLYVPEAEGTNPALQDSFGRAREAIQTIRLTFIDIGLHWRTVKPSPRRLSSHTHCVKREL